VSNPPPTDDIHEGEEQQAPPPPIIEEMVPRFQMQILEYLEFAPLCPECLGRQFSYLATGTDNQTRADSLLLQLDMECHTAITQSTGDKIFHLYNRDPLEILKLLAQRTRHSPSIQLLQKVGDPNQLSQKSAAPEEFKCYLCQNLLLPETIRQIAEKIVEETRTYEFESFLVGTGVDPVMAEREDEFRARFNLHSGEAFKANMNRLVGKQLHHWWNKPVQLQQPDLTILIQLRRGRFLIELHPNSLFLKSRYRKLVRNLPQTQWHCFQCHGSKTTRDGHPCPECKGTGLYYPESIETLIGNAILQETVGKEALFHGAGREDYDARCLGLGRPFILEINTPHRRNLDFTALTARINASTNHRIEITPLSLANKSEVLQYKSASEFIPKIYHVLVYSAIPITQDEFEIYYRVLKTKIEGKMIRQRTPERVSHRRVDKTREKQVFEITGKYIDPVHFFFKIKTQGGTYIKELISGDQGRTKPSFSEIFDFPLVCVELDVIEIE
jgi:tRNA pseudouridine synthase 10